MREGLYARGMDTPHGRVLLAQARAAAEHGAAFLRTAVDEVTGIDELADAYLPALTSDLNQAERLLDALHSGDWESCVEAARRITFDRLKAARKFEDKAFLEEIKAMREEWKTVAKAIRDKWLTVTAEEAEYDRGLTAPALAALCNMVDAFDDAFSAAKRARNAADFNDLEHFAVRLLYDKGEPSQLAKTLSEGFAEIAVDEYQDTNAVQDAIFRALSRDETNLFMVGDVKQSIYGFRLADPSIFLSKYRAFADADRAQDGEARRVILGTELPLARGGAGCVQLSVLGCHGRDRGRLAVYRPRGPAPRRGLLPGCRQPALSDRGAARGRGEPRRGRRRAGQDRA